MILSHKCYYRWNMTTSCNEIWGLDDAMCEAALLLWYPTCVWWLAVPTNTRQRWWMNTFVPYLHSTVHPIHSTKATQTYFRLSWITQKKKMQLQDCVTVSLYVLRFTSPQGTIVCIVCVHSLLIMSDIHNSRKDNWHAWRGCLNCPHGSKCVPTQTGMCSSDALVILMYKLYNWLLCCMIECNCLVMHVQLRQPCTDFLYSPQIVVLVELHL